MAHNIIEGINTVIKGLEMIKEELISKNAQEDLAVKVAGILTGQVQPVEKEGKAKVSPKAEKVEDTKPVESKQSVEDAEETNADRRAELESMSYNEIKALVSSLGGKATGKKDKLIETILELEEALKDGEDVENEDVQETESGDEEGNAGEGESDAEESTEEDGTADSGELGDEEEESDYDVEEFRDFLNDLALDEIEEIAYELGIKFGVELKKSDRKKVTEKCLADIDKLTEVLDELGYYDDSEDDESEVEDTEVEETEDELSNDIAEELGLNEMEVDELADILAEYGLSTKGRKQALIDRIVKAVEDGIIDVAEDDEEEEEEEKPAKKGGKKSKK